MQEHNHFITIAFAVAIGNADLLHSILAFSSCVVSLLRDPTSPRSAYVSRAQAITGLNKRPDGVKAGIDTAAILTGGGTFERKEFGKFGYFVARAGPEA